MIVSGSIINTSTVYLNGIWLLIWHYISKPVLGGHPVLSGHYSIPRGCPLNTGFTVLFQKLSCKQPQLEFLKQPWTLFRPEIWHFLLFSVSGKQPASMITYDRKKIMAQMSQSSVSNGADPECWQIRTVYFRPTDTQELLQWSVAKCHV